MEHLYSFSGRMSRKPWWLVFVAAIIAGIAGTIVLQPELLTSFEKPPKPTLAVTLLNLVLFVPLAAITFRRCNDRDWPTWVPALACAVSLPFYIGPSFGVLMDPLEGQTWEMIFFGIAIVVGLALFVDNGFLRGTPGPNTHGPDPLA